MLKRLELVGFKSFAEKTRFEFPAGITAIVGPNGSGKSNIVDAVRWILGEQSAKSLRGGEMTDVIFNGSGTRRSLGMAEVTMTFDNLRRILPIEADEVQISRRVYRDGTGEYLINQQISRLKDIKDLLLGSGIGTSAYCIIEQGRVDALLQASRQDRRLIFEEAAGISRFKARKIETLRKLERVEFNLNRSRDILAEVDNRLRKVRLEASKAQRYQEAVERLRALRVTLSLRDYHELTVAYQGETDALHQRRAQLDDVVLEASNAEAELAGLEQRLTDGEAQLHTSEAELSQTRLSIAGLHATQDQEQQRYQELSSELEQARRQRTQLGFHIIHQVQELQQAEGHYTSLAGQVTAREDEVRSSQAHLEALTTQLNQLRQSLEEDRLEHMDLVRQETSVQNEVRNQERLVDDANTLHQRLMRRQEQLYAECSSLDSTLSELARDDAELRTRMQGTRETLAAHLQQRGVLHDQAEQMQQTVTERHIQLSSLVSRIRVLEELDRSQEGLSAGVREVIALLANETQGAKVSEDTHRLGQTVLGLVADFLEVPREHAPLIDLVLGDQVAQCFVVRDAPLLDRLLSVRDEPFAGRVSFLPLRAHPSTSLSASPHAPTSVHYLTVGETPSSPSPRHPDYPSLDQWVRCLEPACADLSQQLLGNTLLVPDLATARQVHREFPQFRCITPQGERLDNDGSLTVGRPHTEAGLLSRKSELRELRQEATQLEAHIHRLQSDLEQTRQEAEQLEQPIQSLQTSLDSLQEAAGDLTTQTALRQRRREDLTAELRQVHGDLDHLQSQLATLSQDQQQLLEQAATMQAQVQAIQEQIQQATETSQRLDHERREQEEALTVSRVALARLREQHAAARQHFNSLEQEAEGTGQKVSSLEQQEAELHERLWARQQGILTATQSLALQYLTKESHESQIRQLTWQRQHDRERRQILINSLQQARTFHQDQLTEIHQREMRIQELESRRQLLVDRLHEDYQLDLAELHATWTPTMPAEEVATVDQSADAATAEEVTASDSTVDTASASELSRESHDAPANRSDAPVPVEQLRSEQIQKEIEELRRKLTRLGSVNLEALDELAEVELRARDLQAQHDDLTAAQTTLRDIIHKINVDSRRMFTETLEAIKEHFQEIFRKVFRGGMVDIILDNPEDLLESGIEIMARPPSKELRSISLLSGGEKTMTAIALLMAIFRSKPSPFCLLDEVDAALDEANTTRLAALIKEFSPLSQFIIVTHKKRTMAVADVLYGITMQESGISKQVAVKFEDWPEDRVA